MEEIVDKGLRGAIVGGAVMLLVYGFIALRKKYSQANADQPLFNIDNSKRIRVAALGAAILGLMFVPSEFCTGPKNCGADDWMFIWEINESFWETTALIGTVCQSN